MAPRFSILTPVFDPPPRALEDCLQSVFDQTIRDWELCLSDDASTDADVRRMLDEAARRDDRVRLTRSETNAGIVAASNAALVQAEGEFVALLDHDDLLAPDALEVVADYIDRQFDVDYLYSDEDKISDDGDHFDVFRKPIWSPARLRTQNYCCHLSVFRRSLMEELGGFRPGFDGSQDHDLILRMTEVARRIVHIPRVLYSWRVVPGSAAGSTLAKPYAQESGRRAVQDHCDRIGIAATVEPVPGLRGYQLRRHLTARPLVSLIIPTNGASRPVWGVPTPLVVNAVRSVFERSRYAQLEIVVVTDASTPGSVIDHLRRLGGAAVQIVQYDRPFNFAEKINLGTLSSRGDVVVLLNDDTEVISADWVETLVGVLQEPDVGMVGPKLLFADQRLQSGGHAHGGWTHGWGARHLGAGSWNDLGPFGLFAIERECSGVTAACAALRRATFEEVGGMSPAFPHSFNDVDLSLKLLGRGYRIVWTPMAKLYHFESLSRDPSVRPEESEALDRRWGRFLDDDDFVRFDARRVSDLPAKSAAP